MDSFESLDFLLVADASSTKVQPTETASQSLNLSSTPTSFASLEEDDILADFEVRSGGSPTWFCVIA